jgi:lysyl-tRNA synthetase class I
MATKKKETTKPQVPVCKKCGKPIDIPANLKFKTGGFRCKCGADNVVVR